MRGTAEAYREVRGRILALAEDVEDPERVVPCCPEWTIRELFAHLAGVPTDVLAGRVEGAATDPWTRRQVEERAGRTFADHVDELRGQAAAFDEALDAIGDAMPPELVIDVWTHEQDLRHALGIPGGRSGPAVDYATAALVRALARSVDEAGLPAVEWHDGHETRLVGSGARGVGLRTDRFTFLRARMGRRSRDQLRGLGWDADPGPWLDVLPVFGPTAEPVHEDPAPPRS